MTEEDLTAEQMGAEQMGAEQMGAEQMGSELARALYKGKYLLQMMSLGDRDAGQLQTPPRDSVESSFANVEEPTASGYTTTNKVFDSQYLQQALREIGATDEELCGESSRLTTLYSYQWDSSPYGIMSPYFLMTALPLSGVLIALSNYSPTAVAALENVPIEDLPSDFPALLHWSDVAFLHWKTAILNRMASKELKYVFRSSIQNDRTLEIVDKVLERNSIETLPEWPGITFDIDTAEAQALLGTPNGSGTAFLLVQHKRQLGHKAVEKVTMFYEKNPTDLYRWPSLLFHLKDASPTSS